ncbi:glutathione S-transferase N-terminal domain-containing protein [Alphaproteobacteria bacterium]|nr:glutathione S-transferase N-terminal domain-containing protein [Alphaproteobacteria bacterium]
MHQTAPPIFWSFRRCPYAMRARMAVMASGLTVGLREILLRDKPAAFRAVSSKATVPVLELDDGIILDESRDIMFWALDTSGDPAGWLECYHRDKQAVIAFLDQLEGPFKTALDKYKYATRYRTEEGAPIDGLAYRTVGATFLSDINISLARQPFLSGAAIGLMDYASLPFIRQFRIADESWFDEQEWPFLQAWLQDFLTSDMFSSVMVKYALWQEDAPPVLFGRGQA